MSPVDGGRRGSMELGQLLNTLADPFTTKKQLPRTPESLSKFSFAVFRKEFFFLKELERFQKYLCKSNFLY